MLKLRDGHREVAVPLFRELWPQVHRFCLSLLKNAADADDAAQLGLIKLFQQSLDYREGQAVIAWALSIASWECRTILRRRSRSRATEAEPMAALVDPKADPFEEYSERELLLALESALEHTPESDRTTLRAAFFSLSQGPQDPSQRKRKERALHRLREMMRRIYGLDSL